MIDHFLDFLSPPYCVNCKSLGSFLCENCFEKIVFVKEQLCPECGFVSSDGATHPICQKLYGLNGHLSVAIYQGPVKNLLLAFKYGRFPVKKLSEVIEDILRLYFAPEEDYFPPKTLITPVPLHWWRQNSRGFNQAEILAQILAKFWRLDLIVDLLQRHFLTLPQVKLSKKERVKNVEGLFGLNRKYQEKIKSETVILVDDVYTTGATLKECARVLKEDGEADKVFAVTLAYDEKRVLK